MTCIMSRGKSDFSKICHGKCVERGIRRREKLDIRMSTLSYGPVNNRRIIRGIIERRRYKYVCIVCDSFPTNRSWCIISRDSVPLITRQDKKELLVWFSLQKIICIRGTLVENQSLWSAKTLSWSDIPYCVGQSDVCVPFLLASHLLSTLFVRGRPICDRFNVSLHQDPVNTRHS